MKNFRTKLTSALVVLALAVSPGVLTSCAATNNYVAAFKGPVVDVRTYGATPDDGTNDTAAIQAAIDASKRVHIPAGVYRIDPTVGLVVRNGLTLTGDGKDQTILLPTSTAAGSIIKRTTPTAGGQYVIDVTIRDLAIVLNHVTPAAPANPVQIAFDFRHITRSLIEDCYAGNYNRGGALAAGHAAPTSQPNAVQGYGVVCGSYSSGNPLYSGGEVNTIRGCTLWGLKKCVTIDDASLSPNSGAHATTVENCDMQIAEVGINQGTQYGGGMTFTNNVIQAIQRATGSSATTYAIRVDGLRNRLLWGYIEVGSGCDYAVYLGANSNGNLLHPDRVTGATTDVSDNGTNNDVVTLNTDGDGWRHRSQWDFTGGARFLGTRPIEFGVDGTAGTGFLTSTNNRLTFLTNGAYWNGTNHIANDTQASMFRVNNSFIWYADTGLTPGNSFTPTQVMSLTTNGLAIGSQAATAHLHLPAGSAATNTAPLKFTSGNLNTTPAAGAVEFLGNSLYYVGTDATRRTIANLQDAQTFSGIQTFASDIVVAGAATLQNNAAAAKNATTSSIYGTSNGGGAYPYTEAGHLVLEPRTNGAARDVIVYNSNLVLPTAGSGLKLKTGTNATMGRAVLVGGTVTVSNTKATATANIILTTQVPGGTVGHPIVASRVNNTSFTIESRNGAGALQTLDTSTVAYVIYDEAP